MYGTKHKLSPSPSPLISPVPGGWLRPYGTSSQNPYKEHFNIRKTRGLSAWTTDAIPPAHRREESIKNFAGNDTASLLRFFARLVIASHLPHSALFRCAIARTMPHSAFAFLSSSSLLHFNTTLYLCVSFPSCTFPDYTMPLLVDADQFLRGSWRCRRVTVRCIAFAFPRKSPPLRRITAPRRCFSTPLPSLLCNNHAILYLTRPQRSLASQNRYVTTLNITGHYLSVTIRRGAVPLRYTFPPKRAAPGVSPLPKAFQFAIVQRGFDLVPCYGLAFPRSRVSDQRDRKFHLPRRRNFFA